MYRIVCALVLWIAGAAAAFEIEPLPLPAQGAHAALPRLHAAHDGTVWLSWVERGGEDTHRLRLARLAGGEGWSEPVTAAEGGDWFVNWADFPAVAVTADGRLWAHWLRRTGAAPYAYEVRLAHSNDGGRTWSPSLAVHEDRSETEHGFVSLLPGPDGGLLVAWLDGRLTAAGHDAPGGAMTLRAARFGGAGMAKSTEWLLDARTCDCCQTAAALTASGPVVVYRGRDEAEIRDILLTRFDGRAWTAPRKVHPDRWRMPACPVNGPAAVADGESLWVAWYTVADGLARIRVAHSPNAGDDFTAMMEVDRGPDLLGRVALALDGESLWLAWLSEVESAQRLWLARLPRDLSAPPERIEVAHLIGRGRATGFPQLAVHEGTPLLVWTDVVGGRPTLHGARLLPAATIASDAPLAGRGRPRPPGPARRD